MVSHSGFTALSYFIITHPFALILSPCIDIEYVCKMYRMPSPTSLATQFSTSSLIEQFLFHFFLFNEYCSHLSTIHPFLLTSQFFTFFASFSRVVFEHHFCFFRRLDVWKNFILRKAPHCPATGTSRRTNILPRTP